MPRPSRGPRLYLDPTRKQWAIRDGGYFIRTGCAQDQRARAEGYLAQYLASKYEPKPSASPALADVLLFYKNEHAPHTLSESKILHQIDNLEKFWGDKTLADVSASNCRAFAKSRPTTAARRDLETLRAAVNFWHAEKHPLAFIPKIVMPARPERRERWLTHEEARQLRKAAMKVPHLYRFIVIGLMTGSRSGAILKARWDWVDFERGIMRRRGHGESAAANKQRPPVRIEGAFLRLLRLWKRKDGPLGRLVVHYNGMPVTKLRRSFWTAVKAAGLLGKISPHTLRHTRATWLMQSGTVTPWEASGSLGMSLKVLEEIYAHHAPEYQSNAAKVGSRANTVPKA